jgi:probable phosphoglycerate mutase
MNNLFYTPDILSLLIKKEFYFLRHGQTDWNIEKRCMGQTDIPLNNYGINQAHEVSKLFKTYNITSICHSTLKRTVQTAQIIADYCDGTLYGIEELMERKVGSFEGMLKGDIQKAQKQHHDLNYFPPDAEDSTTLNTRIIKGLNTALQLPNPVLIVSHGGIYRALAEMIGIEDASIENCTPIKFIPNVNTKFGWELKNL